MVSSRVFFCSPAAAGGAAGAGVGVVAAAAAGVAGLLVLLGAAGADGVAGDWRVWVLSLWYYRCIILWRCG